MKIIKASRIIPVIAAALVICAACVLLTLSNAEGENNMTSYNRIGLSEEDAGVTLEEGSWPGAVDPSNHVIGYSRIANSEGLTLEIAEGDDALYGKKYVKIVNSGNSKGSYDNHNNLYIKQRLDDLGLEDGKDYTIFAFIKGSGLNTEKFKPNVIKMSAHFCQIWENDGQVNIGSDSFEGRISANSESFDWTPLAVSFTMPDRSTLNKNDHLNFTINISNLGTICIDGFGIVEGNYQGKNAELRALADRIFDGAKEEENSLGALKEKRVAQLNIAVKKNYKDKADPAYVKEIEDKIRSAKTEIEAESYIAEFFTYMATGKKPDLTMPAKTAESVAEAVSLNDYDWHPMSFTNIVPGTFFAAKPGANLIYGVCAYKGSHVSVELIEGIDYEVDYEKGLIRRLPGTLIPNAGDTGFWEYEDKSYVLGKDYGGKSPNFRGHTIFVTYLLDNTKCDSNEDVLTKINMKNGTCAPDRLIKMLEKDDEELTYLVIGDSINTGAEALPGYTFFDLFAEYMTQNFKNPVKIYNYAIGGYDSTSGTLMLENALADGIEPDLITIGFGMNDQNGEGMKIETFNENYEKMFDFINEHWPKAQVILLTSIPACPVWDLTSGRDVEFTQALVKLGKKHHCPVADCNTLSHVQIERGKHYSEVVTTGINHPGAYGHRLYYLAMASLFDIEGRVDPFAIIIPASCVVCAGAAAGIIILGKKKMAKAKEKIDE